MTTRRRDGLYLVSLGSAIFVILGVVVGVALPHPISDFRIAYYNSFRCLIQTVDPYKQSEALRELQADGVSPGSLSDQVKEMAQLMYPPTVFIVAPFGLLPFWIATVLWTVVTSGVFILASYLMWSVAADYAPLLSGFHALFILASSPLLLVTGNALGLAVGLCAVGAWCIVEDRLAIAGVLCLALSLMIKPHEAGFIWLYFFLASGTYRKRALQALIATTVLSVPLVIWVTRVAPHWLTELRANLAALAARGHLNDPGPSSMAGHRVGMVISLQSVISHFRDDPHFYNTVSYLVCGAVILVWALVVFRSSPTKEKTWLALAAISALSMLPVYHRQGDAKLLLLAVPACAMLWAKGGSIGRIGAVVTTTGIFLIGELQWVIYFTILSHLPPPTTPLSAEIRAVVQIFPVPLALLALGIFYLWVYIRSEARSTTDLLEMVEVTQLEFSRPS